MFSSIHLFLDGTVSEKKKNQTVVTIEQKQDRMCELLLTKLPVILSGSIFLNRGNPAQSIKVMSNAVDFIHKTKQNVFVFPVCYS